MTIKPVADLYLITYEDGNPYKYTRDANEAVDAIESGFKVEEFISLENHRAAMLQGAEHVSDRDELPEGWVACSERMPGSQEWVIVFAKWANQQVLCWDDVANRWTDFEDQSYFPDMFSHWMPLPAAPQQEVK